MSNSAHRTRLPCIIWCISHLRTVFTKMDEGQVRQIPKCLELNKTKVLNKTNLSGNWYFLEETLYVNILLWFLTYVQNTSNLLFTGKTPIVCRQNNILGVAIWLCLFTTTRGSLKPHRLIQHFYLNQLYTTPRFSVSQKPCCKWWLDSQG